jgi:Mg2+-importing ATPase
MSPDSDLITFWNQPTQIIIEKLGSSAGGLTDNEARERLSQRRVVKKSSDLSIIELFLNQFKSPLVLLLIFAAILSFFLQEHIDALVILIIVSISGCLGFWQEWGARDAVKKMLAIVQTKTNVVRDGKTQEVTLDQVVPGDIVQLRAGDTMPGDCLIIESKDLFVNESALTGETYPIEKLVGITDASTPLNKRSNTLFLGTNVVSGTAKAIIVGIGKETEFGKVSQRLQAKPPQTDFEHGISMFGYFLVKLTLLFAVAIFAINVVLHRPILSSFMFSLALAVGLTPQLLPAIISVNLASGAKRMAKVKVIVKRLTSIESFGSMNILCSDKTGTITEGVVELAGAVDITGQPSEKVKLYAYLNSSLETGFANPIDDSLRHLKVTDAETYQKLDETPYDFIRKRLSILVSKDNANQIISKGALQNILDVCTQVDTSTGINSDIKSLRPKINNAMQDYSSKGFRVLGVAYKTIADNKIKATDECDMTLAGLLLFTDPPKANILNTIKELNSLGINLKIITGDNHMVAEAVAKQVGFDSPKILTANALLKLSEKDLISQVGSIDVFAEIEPNQKEAIILALRKAGNVVGYIGDGINDASALHIADVGISVNNAVDVAKEAAQLVMLEHDLAVLIEGVKEGRKTFANTLKYIFMATSANFGNMFSMAGASLLLPFLPQLPKQILFANLMADFPEMAIVTDSVDAELIKHPCKWDISFIRRFMVVFGIITSLFDYLTFAILLFIFKATPEQFRTGWLIESVVSACLIVLILRTRKPFMLSRPSLQLVIANLAVIVIMLILPYTVFHILLELEPLSTALLLSLAAIISLYVITTEIAKKIFYQHYK